VTDTAATPTPIPAPFDGDRRVDDARPDVDGDAAGRDAESGGEVGGVTPGGRDVAPTTAGAVVATAPDAAAIPGPSPPIDPDDGVDRHPVDVDASPVAGPVAVAPSRSPSPTTLPMPTPAPPPAPEAATTPIPGPTPAGATPVAPTATTTRAVPAAARRGRTSTRRVVRRVEPRSVVKVSAVFYACVFVALLVAGIVLWIAAAAAGIVGNVESFIGDLFALDEFRFEPFRILQAAFLGGVVLVALGTAANVVATLLFNLIAELVGGVEVTVADDAAPEPVRRSVV
jgi:hypothetical protein